MSPAGNDQSTEGPFDPAAAEEQALRNLGLALHSLMHEPGSVQLRVSQTVARTDSRILRYRQDDSEYPDSPAYDVPPLLKALRAAMYRPGYGTWFSAVVTVTAAGKLDASYNYDDEPAWFYPVDPGSYAADMREFPRDDAHIPEWLRQRLLEHQGDGPEGDPVSDLTFDHEDGLWDEFPYDPYIPPVSVPSKAHPGDRRVVGRDAVGNVVCVTDFPRHFSLDDRPHNLTHPMQFFTTPRTYLDWMSETCRRTRFVDGPALSNPRQRFAVARQATLTGLEWDFDGNILVRPPAPFPLFTPRRKDDYVVEPVNFDDWRIHRRDGAGLAEGELEDLLDRNLWDVAFDDGAIVFITEVRTDD